MRFALGVFAVALLLPQVARAESEPRETASGVVEHWSTDHVTVTLDPSLENLGVGGTDAIEEAMTTWASGVGGLPQITFVRATEPVSTSGNDGVSVVRAAPITTPGHESDLADTTTYAEDATGNILEADIVFNTTYAYAVMPAPDASCRATYDIGAVATHESGHFFGLDEDYGDTTTTMYVITSACDAHKRVLTSEDTQALDALYDPPTLVAHCDAAPAMRSTPFSTSVFALGFAGALFARKMRRRDARRSSGPRLRG
jgi:hypothetical protein